MPAHPLPRELYLPERFCITIEGKLWNVRRRAGIVPNGLPYMLDRLLNGRMVSAEAFGAFGIRLSVEDDTDQGEDGPDDLQIGRSPQG